MLICNLCYAAVLRNFTHYTQYYVHSMHRNSLAYYYYLISRIYGIIRAKKKIIAICCIEIQVLWDCLGTVHYS